MSERLIGLDIGGTKIEIGVLDDSGAVIWRSRRPTPQGEDRAGLYDQFIDTLKDLILETRGVCEIDARAPIGVCIPGAPTGPMGVLKNSNATWMNGQAFGKDLSCAVDSQVHVANDGACFILSEAVDGAAKQARTAFGIVLGTGVGGGVISNGALWLGAHDIAGEWGHTAFPVRSREALDKVINELGELPACFCGQSLCVESVLQGRAFATRYEVLTGQKKTAEEIAELVAKADWPAMKTLDLYARDLSSAISQIVNIVDPDIIVLGGGLSNIDELYDRVNMYLPSMVFHTGSEDTRPNPIVVKNHWGGTSGLRGAAWLPRKLTAPDVAEHTLKVAEL